MPSSRYQYGQVTEVGADPALGGSDVWDTAPGSAIAYGGTDYDQGAPPTWGAGDALSDAEQLVTSGLNGITQGSAGPLEDWQEELLGEVIQINGNGAAAGANGSEMCPLTMAEWEAHKAQMAADAAHAKKQKMIHLAAAVAGGYFLCKIMK